MVPIKLAIKLPIKLPMTSPTGASNCSNWANGGFESLKLSFKWCLQMAQIELPTTNGSVWAPNGSNQAPNGGFNGGSTAFLNGSNQGDQFEPFGAATGTVIGSSIWAIWISPRATWAQFEPFGGTIGSQWQLQIHVAPIKLPVVASNWAWMALCFTVQGDLLKGTVFLYVVALQAYCAAPCLVMITPSHYWHDIQCQLETCPHLPVGGNRSHIPAILCCHTSRPLAFSGFFSCVGEIACNDGHIRTCQTLHPTQKIRNFSQLLLVGAEETVYVAAEATSLITYT